MNWLQFANSGAMVISTMLAVRGFCSFWWRKHIDECNWTQWIVAAVISAGALITLDVSSRALGVGK